MVSLFFLSACQKAKEEEEEEKVEAGMWEETFKSHSDSKPNGNHFNWLIQLGELVNNTCIMD